MKEIKVITIIVIITIAIMLSCAYAIPVSAEQSKGELYPCLTIVVEKEQEQDSGLWVITCMDKDGMLWEFYDTIGDWEIGDIANLLMWNIGENETDSQILKVEWEGYTENPKLFFHLMEWAH